MKPWSVLGSEVNDNLCDWSNSASHLNIKHHFAVGAVRGGWVVMAVVK
jgi:hypothetical protein